MSSISNYLQNTDKDNSPEMKVKTKVSLAILLLPTAMVCHLCFIGYHAYGPGVQKSHAGIPLFVLGAFIGFPAFILSNKPSRRVKIASAILFITSLLYFPIVFLKSNI